MTVFKYSALNQKGGHVRGTIEARRQKSAINKLKKEGYLIVNIKKEKKSIFSFLSTISTVRTIDKIFFTRHLHTLLESGISLDQAIKICYEQTTNHQFKQVLSDIYERIKKGESLHSALSHHQKYFSGFYINLVRVGEKSGSLEDVLSHLLVRQEQDYELITKTRSALIYPAIIITAAIAIVTLMMVFVIPNITGLLLEYNVELPWTTKVLIFVSDTLLHDGLLVLLFILLLSWGGYRAIKTERGKMAWDWTKLHLPLIKKIVIEFNLARICRSISTLTKSGISIDESLQMTATVTDNVLYQQSLVAAVNFVRRGIPFTEVMHGYPKLYPPIILRMAEIGEKTGKSDQIFIRLAVFYEKSVLNTINNFSAILEPLLLLAIGSGVGFVAVSILLPIWKFAQTI